MARQFTAGALDETIVARTREITRAIEGGTDGTWDMGKLLGRVGYAIERPQHARNTADKEWGRLP